MENKRFVRTEMLLGTAAMQKLAAAKVMIVGLGAVGGYVLEALARAGIGHFVLVDFDVFEESNINRQILALSSTIGQKKTEVARRRILEINPQAGVEIMDTFVNAATVPSLTACRPDMVVDAIDALNPKCALIEELWRRQIPFISAMGAAMRNERRKNSTWLLRSRCHEDTPSTKKQDSSHAEIRVWAYMPQA